MLKVVLSDEAGSQHLSHRWTLLLTHLLVVSGIVLSRESLVATVKIGSEVASFVYAAILGVVLVALVVLTRGRLSLPRRLCVPWLGLVTILVLTTLAKQDFQPYLGAILLGLASVGLWAAVATADRLMGAVSNVVTTISAYSLAVTYLLRPLLFGGALDTFVPRITNLEGVVFYDLGLAFVRDTPFMFRNFGLFREPGAFAFFIAVALIYECAVRRSRARLHRIVILLLAMLSTMSLPGVGTAVLIVLLGLLVARESSDNHLSPRRGRILVLGGVGAVLAVALSTAVAMRLSPNLRVAVLDMVSKLSGSSESNYLRVNAMLNDIELMATHPFLGATFQEVTVDQGITINSYFSVGAHFGIVAFAIIVFSQWRFANWLGTSKLTVAAGLLVFLAVVGSQYLVTNPVYWLLVFSWALSGAVAAQGIQESSTRAPRPEAAGFRGGTRAKRQRNSRSVS